VGHRRAGMAAPTMPSGLGERQEGLDGVELENLPMGSVAPASPLALARRIDPDRAEDVLRDMLGRECAEIAALLGAAFPPLRANHGWQVDALTRIVNDGWHAPIGRKDLGHRLASAVGDLAAGDAVGVALRRQVWAEKARVALREVLPASLGGVDVDRSARELSYLAEVALDVALGEAALAIERRFGAPKRANGARSSAVVFGMGKLGGRELNAGSDVDLIAFYDTDEGESAVTLHEHWTHVVRRAVATVEAPTADGSVWRVDLRLRPEGSQGPVAYSWAAAERYYETWGRLWERAALLRARPVAGDRALGESFQREVITPFVFRRDVDPAIATALASLIQRSRAEQGSDPERDLKLGPGGIREAEFFAQALQLIWGGREPRLRTRNTLRALERLRVHGFVTDREAGSITYAYLLLRRVEHAIQWRTGIQTHLLPTSVTERDTLARILGFADGAELLASLAEARSTVSELFASILPETPHPPSRHAILLAKLAEPDGDLAHYVAEVFGDPDLVDHLVALSRRPDGPLGALTLDRHPGLADELLDAIADCSDPEQAARYLRALYGRFVSPTPYVTALARDAQVVGRLVTVLGASAFVGDAIVARPDLADVLFFDTEPMRPETAREAVRAEVDQMADRVSAGATDEERREELIEALRTAQGKVMLQVAVSDLGGELDMRGVTSALSTLADETLDQAVRSELCGDPRGLAVIAMGKLGGREIGYGSDLDLIFIYDPAAAPGTEDATEYFVRRAQRVFRLLTRPHHAGPGYQLDTRLRPSGSHGLLVTSLEAFARYHRVPFGAATLGSGPAVLSSGAAWERQALLRARACAGDLDLGRRVIEVAHVAAYERGAPPAEELHHMRMRMERELGRERPGRFDLKLGRGGLLDVEFATQWLQMRHGADHAVRTTDTLEALEALYECGYLAANAHQTFRAGYRFLRRLEQRIRVLHGSGSSRLDASSPGLVKLARRMGFERRAYSSEEGALLESYRDVTSRVRSTYLDVLALSSTDPRPAR
jgi:glutamate-ammonia-ligase adenylyltransferase